MNKKNVLDAGTTWSKIIEYNTDELKQIFSDYLRYSKENKNYYILPSAVLKTCDLKFDAMTGHMSEKFVDNKDSYVNEIIALSSGVKNIEENSIILDLGSRDAKWVRFVDGKFKDLDWNTACASSTGATIEMLMKFYNLKPENLSAAEEKYSITCGIFGLERIMDDIARGESSAAAVSKFIHGIAFNTWNFARRAEKIYLSGGFCENKCFVESLNKYCELVLLGRFVLCDGILQLLHL